MYIRIHLIQAQRGMGLPMTAQLEFVDNQMCSDVLRCVMCSNVLYLHALQCVLYQLCIVVYNVCCTIMCCTCMLYNQICWPLSIVIMGPI